MPLVEITTDIRNIAKEAIDSMIEQLGKPCRLVFPDVKTTCPNCILDMVSRKSSGRYKSGGAIPFEAGMVCPVCEGEGEIVSSGSSMNITLLTEENPAKWWVPPPRNVVVPDGMLQTKGYAKDIPSLKRALYLVYNTPVEGLIRYRYTLEGEPVVVGSIVQARYVVCTWARKG